MGANYSTTYLQKNDCGITIHAHKLEGITVYHNEQTLATLTSGITTFQIGNWKVYVWVEEVTNGYVFAAWRKQKEVKNEYIDIYGDFVLAFHLFDDYDDSIKWIKNEKDQRRAAKQAIKKARRTYMSSVKIPIKIRAALGSFFATDKIIDTNKKKINE